MYKVSSQLTMLYIWLRTISKFTMPIYDISPIFGHRNLRMQTRQFPPIITTAENEIINNTFMPMRETMVIMHKRRSYLLHAVREFIN
jgi:hypothetical protein